MDIKAMETLKVLGDHPLARFGHTMTVISKTQAVLFGGAIGDTGKYSITNDTFLYDISSKKWKKLNPGGQVPSVRAAHASCALENFQMIIYGGAIGGGFIWIFRFLIFILGGLASDDLFLLELKEGEDNCRWLIVPVIGVTPGRRYGHTIVFYKPNLIVFGGNTGNDPINDVWILALERPPYSWVKIEYHSPDVPFPRAYHAAAVCGPMGPSGMMVVVGGRTGDAIALNDTWGFRRHRDGKWDWVKATYKENSDPLPRYQVYFSII